MRSRNKLLTLALMSSTAIGAAGLPAFAQDEASAVIEEVLVTATRRSQNIQDIPYNISAVSGADLDRAQVIDASEMIRSLPGVASADRGARNAATVNNFRIRGLNVDGAARGDYAASSAPTVATYINDTPVFANMLLKDMERVEVLRGPQGTLYGSGALGGALRFITNKPNFDGFEGYVNGSGSKTDGSGSLSWNGDVMLNLASEDKMAFRVVASRIDTAGIIDYVNVYDLDGNGAPVVPGDILDNDASFSSVEDADTAKIDFLRATATFMPADFMDVTLMATVQRDRIGGRRATTQGYATHDGGTYGEYTSGSVQLEPAETDLEMYSAEVDIDFGFATLTSSTSYYDVAGSSISENTGFYAQKGWLGNLYYNSPRPLARADRSYGDKAWIQEVRLVSNDDGPVDWVVGAYYQDQDKNVGQTSTLAGYRAWTLEAQTWMSEGFGHDANDNDFIYRDDTKIKETAIFGEVSTDVTERLRLTGGFRWFDSSVGSDAEVQLPFWDSLASWAPALTVTESGKKDVLFKGNLAYDMSDDQMLYATVSQGYRRGGASAVPTAGNFAEDPAWLNYGSDSVTNYEVGIKGANDQMRYTLSAFYVDWSNPQINTATSNWGFFTAANGDTAATKGLELEIDGRIGSNVQYNIGYAYVSAKLTSDFNAPTGALIAADGNKMPGVPSHMLNYSIDHTSQLSGDWVMVARLGGYLQSSTQNYINNTSALYGHEHSAFSVLNASALFENGDVAVTVFVKNIFNTEGVTAIFSEDYMGTSPDQNYLGNGAKREITLPRTIGVALKYNF